jgi:hypothetical protein
VVHQNDLQGVAIISTAGARSPGRKEQLIIDRVNIEGLNNTDNVENSPECKSSFIQSSFH